jgi:ABC-type enterochelin transport system ATPase subunit
MGIASVCHNDIAWSPWEMLERFTCVDIADQHLDALQGHQVHREMEAMVCACG